MKNAVVIYHGGCDDGFGGAFAAWKKFGLKADYIGALDRDKLPTGLKDKEVYLIDYTYKLPLLGKLLKIAKRVVVIDHHITAREAAKRAHESLFDLKHSGAVLAWKYFHPRRPVPLLLRYVEDIDLWKFKLRHTRELIALLESHQMMFKAWDMLARGVQDPKTRREYVSKGAVILWSNDKLAREIVEAGVEVVRFAGYQALAVNSPVFQSEIGHILARRSGTFGIVWRVLKGNKIRVSLRSAGKVDVSKIAARFGAGGHKNAAGFNLPEGARLPWRKLKL